MRKTITIKVKDAGQSIEKIKEHGYNLSAVIRKKLKAFAENLEGKEGK